MSDRTLADEDVAKLDAQAVRIIKGLTADLEHADRINGDSVNRIVALEAENAALRVRIKRLRDCMYSAYQNLALASSEDSQHDQ